MNIREFATEEFAITEFPETELIRCSGSTDASFTCSIDSSAKPDSLASIIRDGFLVNEIAAVDIYTPNK